MVLGSAFTDAINTHEQGLKAPSDSTPTRREPSRARCSSALAARSNRITDYGTATHSRSSAARLGSALGPGDRLGSGDPVLRRRRDGDGSLPVARATVFNITNAIPSSGAANPTFTISGTVSNAPTSTFNVTDALGSPRTYSIKSTTPLPSGITWSGDPRQGRAHVYVRGIQLWLSS